MNINEMMKPYVIGLDLGGTNSVFGIVDSRGEIKATTAIKTQGYDSVEDYVDAAVEALKVIIDQVGGINTIKAMGIGAPNGNFYTGTIEFAPNLSWGRSGIVPLADMFSKRLEGIPVGLTNDANAAAIGEMTYGVARGMKNFMVITLGTGVGSGIVVTGQMVYGRDGFAGELGHMIDALANRVYDFTGKLLGEACANFMTFSSPEAFIFFGGLTKAGDLLMKPLIESYNDTVLPIYKNKAKFLISGLEGSSAAVLGASAVGWEL